MKGYYVKAAQMSAGMDLLPEAYDKEMKTLLDEVPPRDAKIIHEIIE